METVTLPIALSKPFTRYLAIGLGFLSFVVPFSLGHPQFLVGSIVNASLFASAIVLPKKYFWPIIFLPSLAVLLRGAIFGPFTLFLVYFLPFIWLGNLGLVWIFKNIYEKSGFIWALAISALGKQLILFMSAQLFFTLKLVPKIFLTTMGINQLLTAITGGLIAYLILFVFLWNNKAQK